MGNILGEPMPTILIDTVEYQLPVASRNNRNENFEAEKVAWTDIDRVRHERVKGYRLIASYGYEYLINDDFEDLLTIYNATSKTRNIFMRFSVFPRLYQVRVTNFEHGLASGYSRNDSATIEFEGIRLVNKFPNPDDFYTIMRPYNRIISV